MTDMNPWTPDTCPQQARRVGKTLEELGELTAVLGRISIQGLHAIDPASGKTNRQRMVEEMADVLAQFKVNIDHFGISEEELLVRADRKIEQMSGWESHFDEHA
jgi:NTP pyrophosphatase (non-canonical NTP hydrolase)